MGKNEPNSITQSEAPEPEEIVLHKLRSNLSVFSGESGEKVQIKQEKKEQV